LRGDLWDGDAVAELERAFADFIGAPDAVAVPSGRAGLRFTFDALGLEPGSEVICSAFGYPVVPHITRSMGYDVRFADCELETLGMDPEDLARTITDRTRVVIVTHLYGVPCRIREIAEITEAHGAILIEDCAHCFGASVGGRKLGSIGRFGYFSFETSKPINTLGGGMVTLRDPAEAQKIRDVARAESPKNLGWLRKRLLKTSFEATVTHPAVFNLGVYPALRLAQRRAAGEDRFASGYQQDEISVRGKMGRFTNYQAKLGLRQMQTAQQLIERRVANAERLFDRVGERVKFQTNNRSHVRCNYMLVTALFPDMPAIASRLLQLGVDTKHQYMRDCSRLLGGNASFPGAERAEREVLHLPAYPELNESQIDEIADKVLLALDSVGGTETPALSPVERSASRSDSPDRPRARSGRASG
jgi:dTDP-4-amino-4,6-dideoxygalactose transaminase